MMMRGEASVHNKFAEELFQGTVGGLKTINTPDSLERGSMLEAIKSTLKNIGGPIKF